MNYITACLPFQTNEKLRLWDEDICAGLCCRKYYSLYLTTYWEALLSSSPCSIPASCSFGLRDSACQPEDSDL
ncbi:hypothetical protein ACRRTK_008934 [Alexandromys fortis]